MKNRLFNFISSKLFTINFFIFNFGFLIAIFFKRKFILFRDYSIIWDGAYRISEGLLPYKDFGIPLGPVSFYLPSFLFSLFGPSWINLQISQIILNFFFLILIFKLLKALNATKMELFLGLFFFVFNFLILLSHPWYNVTAAFLYLSVILSLTYDTKIFNFIAGILSAICIFTKQDYGLLSLFSGLSLSFLTYKDSLNNLKIIDFYNFKNEIYKRFFNRSFLFIFGFLIAISVFIFIYASPEFFYWFNFGQSPHSSRFHNLYKIIFTPQFYLALVSLYIAFNKKDPICLLSFFILITSSISSKVSGQSFTSTFYVFLLPILFLKVYRSIPLKNNFIYLFPIASIFIISLFDNSQRILGITKGIYRGRGEPYTMLPNDARSPVVNIGYCGEELKNIYGPQAVCNQISKVKDKLKSVNSNKELIFLNISELTVLNSIFKLSQPNNLPLWFDTNVILFEREINIINQAINNSEYHLIALQATHNNWSSFYSNTLNAIILNKDYQEIGNFQEVSPSGVLFYDFVNHQCLTSNNKDYKFSYLCEKSLKPIRFFIKKSSIQD